MSLVRSFSRVLTRSGALTREVVRTPRSIFVLLSTLTLATLAFWKGDRVVPAREYGGPQFHDFFKSPVTKRIVLVDDVGPGGDLLRRYRVIFDAINRRSAGVSWTLHESGIPDHEPCVFYRAGESVSGTFRSLDFVIEPVSDFERRFERIDSTWSDILGPESLEPHPVRSSTAPGE